MVPSVFSGFTPSGVESGKIARRLLSRILTLAAIAAALLWVHAPAAGASPGSNLTRAELAELMVTYLKLEPYLPQTPVFRDVPLDHPAAQCIYAALRAGIMKGYPDGTYQPDGAVSRAEVALLFYRVLGSPAYEAKVLTYPDVSDEHWAYLPIEYLTSVGIVRGYPDGTFRPESAVLYDDAVAALKRIAEADLDVNSDGFVDTGDLAAILGTYGVCAGSPGWNRRFDVTRDGRVDIMDLVLLARHMGQ